MKLKLAIFITFFLAVSLACNGLSIVATDMATRIPPSEATETSESAEPTATIDVPDNPNPGSDGIGDPYFEDLGNGGYNVQHYELALHVDMDANEIAGTATIQASTTQALTSLNLDFIGMNISRVAVNGEETVFQRQGAELVIYLPDPLANGTSFQIEVDYQGTPGEDVDRNLLPEYSEGWIYYDEGLMVAGEPTGASTWFPVNEHPADKATYTFAINVDEPLVVAANGVLTSTDDQGSNVTYTWEMRDPIAPYLVTIAIGEFDIDAYTGPSGVPIRNYFGAGVSQNVRDDFDKVGEMIEYFETIFGPYPFEVYGVVVHDLDLNFALETATLVVYGKSFTDEEVVSHELTHMWFGDSVGLRTWKDIWLNEGFATYGAELWNEHAYGREVLDDNVRSVYEEFALYGSFFGNATVGDPGPGDLFSYPVYYRGMLTLHALRLEIGDADFFETLRTYTARFGHANASTREFIAIAEEISGQQLDDFFEAWIYRAELPDIPQMDLFAADFEE